MLYQFSRLRELVLRTNFRLFGHRLTMDRVVPGGVIVDITSEGKKTYYMNSILFPETSSGW